MRTAPSWIRRGLLVALVVGVGAALSRWVGSGSEDGLPPSVGGDTWPPVPVKPAPPG